MNLILVAPGEEEDGGRVVLRGRRARHAVEVLRVAAGDELRVGRERGARGVGTVVAVAPGEVVLACRFDAAAPPPPWLDVILAVPRPKVLARVVEALASFGVRRIELVNAWRVDKSFFGSHRVADAALAAALRLGCEQGGTTWLPEIAVHPLLVPFLRDELRPRLDAERRVGLVAHPAAQGIENVAIGDRPVTLAVGPEGGWIASELASFAALGFHTVSAGAAVLRVEAALPALVAQLWMARRLR